ncbi:helix-turn-helix domain-containing protein [Natrinema salsiterrestre]|uniref:Helix-turn-helix domain-containing protein n=1 Tax=Natrinema salsiterrestre TaxID=2950540 RepID=A0A9Q4KZF1_9EURY|nr:helix-turn-helix domain-containing protein [Natrinema salsiterrestre]MDF9744364.1 helix-turn-helix domain-containing protein [Natrinema salsiterrestre]
MLLATLLVDYPILRETLSNAPGVTLTWEQSDLTGDGDHRMLVWVDGSDDEIAAFEAGLDVDPTVAESLQEIAFGDRWLYQLELTSAGKATSVYPTVIKEGGVLQEVTATDEGWFFRVAFPSNEALERFHAFFLERDLEVDVRKLRDTRETADSGDTRSQFGVTNRQREALVAAVDAGYLDIPQSCSLAELGERLDISQNAASERFRRGVRTLIENTVYSDDRSL